MKKWNLLYQIKNKKLPASPKLQRGENLKSDEIVDILLENRGLRTKKDKDEFLNLNLSKISIKSVGIDNKELQKTLKRIKKAIKNNEKIIIFGDYDVDGICGSAILWETLNKQGANVLPYIPSRFEEGYGLSIKGIDNVIKQNPDLKLIITVDNGIVASDAVDYANKKGIEVIVTDHHVKPLNSKLPKSYATLHTTNLCGTGVAYLLSKELRGPAGRFPPASAHSRLTDLRAVGNPSSSVTPQVDNHLELVALATIADLVPLTKANRAFVYFGLQALRKTKRPGLLALYAKSTIDKEKIGVYEVGYILAPRLNAMGRLTSAMDSLRLICTSSEERANTLAETLAKTNLARQELTSDTLNHAIEGAKKNLLKNLIFIADKSYQEGIIGLVAGRLVEEYYMPSIVISKGEVYSKASARSVLGFNIVEFLRESSDLLVDVGGHPMAAGFTVETQKLELLEKTLYEKVSKLVDKEYLERKLNIDMELAENLITPSLYSAIQKLSPFGMANAEPLFLTKNLRVADIKIVGKDGKHLRFNFQFHPRPELGSKAISNFQIQGIYFGAGINNKILVGDKVDVVYTISVNEWNGNTKLQLKVKDVKLN